MGMKEKATWRDPALGVARELDLPQGRLRYFEAGTGSPIVFVHGLLVNANLWRKVLARLSPEFRCVALELPLGSHTLPMPEAADLTPHGLADLVADAIEALALEEVTLVGNDTGGALCQMVVTRRPKRVGRLVLTSCDYRDNFPPAMFRYFKPAAAIPGAMRLLMVADAPARAAPAAVRVRVARQAADRPPGRGLVPAGGHDHPRRRARPQARHQRAAHALHERGRRPAGRVRQAGADRLVAR